MPDQATRGGELQAVIDPFVACYNEARPHRSIGRHPTLHPTRDYQRQEGG